MSPSPRHGRGAASPTSRRTPRWSAPEAPRRQILGAPAPSLLFEPKRIEPMQQHKPVRIAVVGCGAVTQSVHLPVLAGHEGVSISALVDPDVKRAERLAALYHVPLVLPSIDRLDRAVADAALIATPAFLHAPGSIELMNRGLHVLVEKPMALTLAEAERMVATSRERRRVLTVGLFRRLLPAVRLFRAALDAGEIGELTTVTAEVGDTYTWQPAT